MEHYPPAPLRSSEAERESRFLIVNSDDFGRTEAINRGIIEAHENGIVTSASLMVSYPAAIAAAAYARRRGALSVGLHFEVYEWRYRDGEWESVYERVAPQDVEGVRAELHRQVSVFRELLGRAPTHLDSHQHAHMEEPIRSVVLEYAQQHRLPVRACDHRIAFSGSFYGQTAQGEPLPEGITPEQLMATLAALPVGWTELGCHPGYADGWETDYRSEREQELHTLCDPRLPRFLADARITLQSFRDFGERQ